MPIQVTCPGCLKRFQVSEKFAGKTGPCPSCQKKIKIPEKSEEAVIHAPEEAGPKDSKGRAVLKPIRRSEVKLSLPVIIGASVATVTTLLIALFLGLGDTPPPTAFLAISAIVLALPMVFVGYWFLRDDELGAYTGRSLLVRIGIGSLGFALTWAIYAIVPMYLHDDYQSLADISGLEMAIFVLVMCAAGTLISVAAFELELLNGLMHYVLYFAVTLFLTWLAGTPVSAPLSGAPKTPSSQVAPANAPASGRPQIPPPVLDPGAPKVPNLLQ